MLLCHLQQSGRAGRDGKSSIAYLFWSSAELKNASGGIQEFIECSENCRRAVLLNALGSKEKQPDRIPCCNGCQCQELPPELDIVHQIDSTSRRRSRPLPKRVRVALHEALLVARQQVVDMSPGLQMLGPEVVCSSRVISDLCRNIGHIETVT